MKNDDTIHRIRVFIAGSKALEEQRKVCRAVLMQQQNLFDNIVIEAKTFEDFSDALVAGGAQKVLYNAYIAEKADVAAFIFDSSVGGITMQEFDVAYDSFKEKDSPKIFVYIKKEEQQNKDILKLKERLDGLDQYYIEYKDDKNLEVLFGSSINRYIIDKYWRTNNKADEEKVAFDLACQKLSNTLISCLSVIDEFSCVLDEVSEEWNRFLSEYKKYLPEENKIYLKNELFSALNHHIGEVNRISKIYPPGKISFSNDDIRLLAPQVRAVSEIKVLPSMYASYFDDVLSPFRSINDFLHKDSLSNIERKMVELHINGFHLMAEALFYTALEYLVQLPSEYQKNLKEMFLLWHNYPKNVSLNMSPDDYERFAKVKFDECNSNIIKISALLDNQEEELDELRRKIEEMKRTEQ